MAKVSKFYIENTEVKIEISPKLANTLDESLDNLNVRTIAGTRSEPYNPFTKFYIKDENSNIIQTFIISADSVETASVNPLRYIHNLSLIQLSEYLSKYEIRNSVFSNSLETNNFNLYLGSRFFVKAITNPIEIYKNINTVSFSLDSRLINSIKFSPWFYACYQYYHWVGDLNPNIKYFDLEEDYSAIKWSDLYKNANGNVEYPQIILTIGNESTSWQLSDFIIGKEILLPKNILNWIADRNVPGATLSITMSFFNSLNGFTLSPLEDINCPLYGNLSFDIEINYVQNSVYSVIDTLLKQQMKETDDYNANNDLTIQPLFLMPTLTHNSELYNLLMNTNAPNFVLTQSTFYDALVEIFKLFDAIFTIDNDGYLDIEYFNDNAQSEIDEPEIAGKNKALGEEYYTNKLITYFQNTKIEHRFPNSNDVNATAYVGSKTFGVPSQSDFTFVLPKPIDILKKVKLETYYKLKYIAYEYYDEDNIYHEEVLYFVNTKFNRVIDITPLHKLEV